MSKLYGIDLLAHHKLQRYHPVVFYDLPRCKDINVYNNESTLAHVPNHPQQCFVFLTTLTGHKKV